MPSAADRWMTCAASPRFCLENADLIPADLSSKFSREGNTAHEVAAAFLENREPNPDNCPTPIDPEMRLHAWNYAEYVESFRNLEAGLSKLIVEHKQPLWYYEGRNAVVDAAVLNPDSLHIFDLKYGAGVAVSAQMNRQMTIYARQIGGSMGLPMDFPVTCHIYQPRCRDNAGEPADVWKTTWGEIQRLSDEMADHAQVILNNHRTQGQPLDFVASEKACRWCPAKGFCPERQKELLDGIEALSPIEPEKKLPEVKAIPIDQLAKILLHKSDIEKWLKDAEDYALHRMKDGHEIPGFKLVMSRGGNRAWSDPKRAGNLLVESTILKREEVFSESVITVAQAEKLLGKNKLPAKLDELITRKPGVPEIAPLSDKREEITIKAENEFTAIPDGHEDFE